MLNTILIDDEPRNLVSLTQDIEENCPEVIVIATCNTPQSGIEAIQKMQPDIVFLDIEMPQMSGFDVIEYLQPINFSVIFVTAHDHYALRAFDYSATDYLLKPIQTSRLVAAVERAKQHQNKHTSNHQIEFLLQSIRVATQKLPHIPIPTTEGYDFVAVSEIVYAEADGNYTKISLKNGKKLLVAKTLKDFEGILDGHNFLRTHQSYLVNIHYIARYIKGSSGYLLLSNGQKVEISRAMKPRVMEALIR